MAWRRGGRGLRKPQAPLKQSPSGPDTPRSLALSPAARHQAPSSMPAAAQPSAAQRLEAMAARLPASIAAAICSLVIKYTSPCDCAPKAAWSACSCGPGGPRAATMLGGRPSLYTSRKAVAGPTLWMASCAPCEGVRMRSPRMMEPGGASASACGVRGVPAAGGPNLCPRKRRPQQHKTPNVPGAQRVDQAIPSAARAAVEKGDRHGDRADRRLKLLQDRVAAITRARLDRARRQRAAQVVNVHQHVRHGHLDMYRQAQRLAREDDVAGGGKGAGGGGRHGIQARRRVSRRAQEDRRGEASCELAGSRTRERQASVFDLWRSVASVA